MILIFPIVFSTREPGHVNCNYTGFLSELFFSLKYADMEASLQMKHQFPIYLIRTDPFCLPGVTLWDLLWEIQV